jgi:hypothetical protein
MANLATMALDDIACVRVNLEAWRGQRDTRTIEAIRDEKDNPDEKDGIRPVSTT